MHSHYTFISPHYVEIHITCFYDMFILAAFHMENILACTATGRHSYLLMLRRHLLRFIDTLHDTYHRQYCILLLRIALLHEYYIKLAEDCAL